MRWGWGTVTVLFVLRTNASAPIGNFVAPKFLSFASRSKDGGGRTLSVFFHNNFGLYESTPCSLFDGFPAKCEEHPRCQVENLVNERSYESSYECHLHPAYLALLDTPEVCEMAHVTSNERMAVLEDLQRGGNLPEHIESYEDGTDGGCAVVCDAIRTAHRSRMAARAIVSQVLAHGLADQYRLLVEPNRPPSSSKQLNIFPHISRPVRPTSNSPTSSFFDRFLSAAKSSALVRRLLKFRVREGEEYRLLSPRDAHGAVQFIGPSDMSEVVTRFVGRRGQPSTVRMGINGFGTIGRLTLREALSRPEIVVKWINAPHLSQDQMEHVWNSGFEAAETNVTVHFLPAASFLVVERFGRTEPVRVSHHRDAASVDWKSFKINYVVESTGQFCSDPTCLDGKRTSPTPKKSAGNTQSGQTRRRLLHSRGDALVSGYEIQRFSEWPNDRRFAPCSSCAARGLPPHITLTGEQGKDTFVSTLHLSEHDSSAQCERFGRCQKLTSLAESTDAVDVQVVSTGCVLDDLRSFDVIRAAVENASSSYLRGIVGFVEEAWDGNEDDVWPPSPSGLGGWPKCSSVFDGFPDQKPQSTDKKSRGWVVDQEQRAIQAGKAVWPWKLQTADGSHFVTLPNPREWANINRLLETLAESAAGGTYRSIRRV